MPVAVVIDERATAAPACRVVKRKPCLPGHIGKRAVSVVAIQYVFAVVRAKQIFEAVVVVIADADCGRPAGAVEPGLLCNVSEGAITIVMVETIRGPGRCAAQPSSREEKNVEPAIIVVIDEGAPAPGGFQDVVVVIGRAVNHWRDEARFARDVGEARIERAPRCARFRLRLYVARSNALR